MQLAAAILLPPSFPASFSVPLGPSPNHNACFISHTDKHSITPIPTPFLTSKSPREVESLRFMEVARPRRPRLRRRLGRCRRGRGAREAPPARRPWSARGGGARERAVRGDAVRCAWRALSIRDLWRHLLIGP